MCGIVGVVSDDPSARDASIVRSMAGAVQHRGPDDHGLLEVGNATLAAQRLSIVDVAGGHQPMTDLSGRIGAVQNGELYNFLDLRAQLEAGGARFRTNSDTEILPYGFERWGEHLAEKIRGMFAFAVWDRVSETLLLARDRFGKKPLLYAEIGGGIAFASEMQGLLRHPAVSREIDEHAIGIYLALGYIPAPYTAFKGIRKLPPAHTLTMRNGRLNVHRYWRLSTLPKLDISLDEAAVELRSRIDEAVRIRLMGEVPIGVFLSGGLDSSTVVAFMARHVGKVRTFSIGFGERHLDELPHARVVARAFGTQHEELVVGHDDVETLPMLVRHVGEPFADSSVIPTYQVARLTRPHVTVALTGDGGDELFLGYDRYRAALVADKLAGLGGPLRGALALASRALPTGHLAPRSFSLAARFFDGLHESGPSRYLRWSGYSTGRLRSELFGGRLAASAGIVDSLVATAYDERVESVAERYALADTELGLPGDLLTKMDIATMAASLEARSPLLDHELAEFVARLPAAYKVSAGGSKIVLRRAMADILPPETLGRGKRGFVAPVDAWLRGPLRLMFEDLVLDGEAVRRQWVTGSGVRRMYDGHVQGRRDRTRHLWSLLVLEVWCREIAALGRPSAAAV